MPSSKTSIDHRDVYYRLGKSAGYRARSAYKLLHLDEEFELFQGVETAVDLCAAPGSWSQVLAEKVKPGKEKHEPKVVSIDLQPMAPLPNITILQTDITLPSTIPLVLNALGGRKADLVVCDGAPDVTGVHDLDAYLHSQLLLAALTLSLTLLAPHATLIFKIFLSPLDPQASMLKSQLEVFFASPPNMDGDYKEFDEENEVGESGRIQDKSHIGKPGFDQRGRRGGVWVRKPRSSRKGSGEAFIVCRNFDSSKVPLPITFSPEALERLAQQTTGTLTLESVADLVSESQVSSKEWDAIKAYVGKGDLDPEQHERSGHSLPRLQVPNGSSGRASRPAPMDFSTGETTIEGLARRTSSVRSLRPLHSQPTPCDEPEEYFPASNSSGSLLMPVKHVPRSPLRSLGLLADSGVSRSDTGESSSSSISPTNSVFNKPWDRVPSPLPTPQKGNFGTAPSGHSSVSPISPTFSSGSRNDLFATSQNDGLPTPPKPLSHSPSIGKGLPNRVRGHDRAVSTPEIGTRDIFGSNPSRVELLRSPGPSFPTGSIFDNPNPNSAYSSPRINSDTFPAAPLSTLPTLPSIATASPPRPLHQRRESQQLPREIREGPQDDVLLLAGNVLVPILDEQQWPTKGSTNRWKLRHKLGEGAFSAVWSAEELLQTSDIRPMVAAVKMTSRSTCASNARTRIAFLREVSVLRHISHPNVVSFISSFSTTSHHCMVVEQLSGGELLDLVSDDENRQRMLLPGPEDAVGEGFIRRIYSELTKGVGWLHEVGVVHRDIKLENILLAVNPFLLPPTSTGSIPLDSLPTPLVKLTDFGLSRFINLAEPALQTRCGSESFAAPEIIMGRSYDGRETDAWAMGVVLYALVAGELPFDTPEMGKSEKEERKRRMMRIAKGQYTWPEGVGSAAVREVVDRLLVRDPKKRMRVVESWDTEWFKGPGEISPPKEDTGDGGVEAGLKKRKVLDGFLLNEALGEEASAEL